MGKWHKPCSSIVTVILHGVIIIISNLRFTAGSSLHLQYIPLITNG